jgi:hypothetical protein
MDKLIGKIPFTLLQLEGVMENLPNQSLKDAALGIIEKFEDKGIISEYEFNIATDLVLLGLGERK